MKPIKVKIDTEIKLSRVLGGLLLSMIGAITYWAGVLLPFKTKATAVAGFLIGLIIVFLFVCSFTLIENKK